MKISIKESLESAKTHFDDGYINTGLGILKDLIERIEAVRKES